MIKIVTDSTADIPKGYKNKYDITVLPLSINIDGKTYRDGIDIGPADVCDYMQKGKIPKTSQVPPHRILQCF